LKKSLAIGMLALLLFNMGGYLLVFQYFIIRSDNAIDEQINNNHYKSADLVNIKIPVRLNIQDWSDYEVISGQVKIKDTIYNYAELKMTRDTMYLKCITNHEKGRLVNAKIIYGKQVNDAPVNKKMPLPLVKKNFSENEYICTNNKLPGYTTAGVLNTWHNYAFIKVCNTSINFVGQPPDPRHIIS